MEDRITHKTWKHFLITALLVAVSFAGIVHATENARGPLPTRLFENLSAGKKQTVVVYGTSLSHFAEWPKALERYFKERFPGQVSLHNSAMSGRPSNWGVENLPTLVLDKKPDLVFIEFSMNDSATKHGISVKQGIENLDRMVTQLREQNPQIDIVLQTMNPSWDTPQAPGTTAASDRPALLEYYESYREYARKYNLPLIDHHKNWVTLRNENQEQFRKWLPDGTHPIPEGSLAVTWPAIETLLESARRSAGLSAETIDVWPEGKMPGIGAREPEKPRPSKGDNVTRITNVSRPTLTLFPAEEEDGPAPAMIVCPGGGYGYVVVDKEGSEIAEWLNSIGISALVLKYRVPNNRAGALQDIQRALSLTRARATEWRIDAERLGVIGFSAGGHLCAKASTQFGERTYAPIDDIDEQSCRPDFAVLVYPAYLEKDGRVAEDLNLKADIPPTLIVHNEDDRKLVAGSKIYAAALEKLHVPHEFLLYPTGGHGYGLRCTGDARVWPQDAEKWLTTLSGSNGKQLAPVTRIDAPFDMPQLQRPVFREQVFDIRDYGAVPGESVTNTEAIGKAITACHKAGGGTVIVPEGKWLTGPVHLKSHVNLKVVKGAELLFSDDKSLYLPAVESAWEGLSLYNYSPLIYAVDCENIGLTGKGRLVCNRKGWAAWDSRPPSHLEASKKLYYMAADNVPVEERRMANDQARMRPPFIQFLRCRNVLIEGLTIRNSPFWTIHPLKCENVIARDLDLYCRGHNTDGIDPDQTKNMLIEDCIFDQGDDAIVIKAGRNHDGWRGQASENIVIRNCTIRQGHNLLAIGSELSGGVRNVYLHDCTFDFKGGYVRSCLLIKTNHRRGGTIENITIRNAHCDKVTSALLEIDTDVLYQWRNMVETRDRRLTTIRNISLENVSVGEAKHGIVIKGEKELPVRNISLKNVRVDRVLEAPRVLSNVENLKEDQVVFTGK